MGMGQPWITLHEHGRNGGIKGTAHMKRVRLSQEWLHQPSGTTIVERSVMTERGRSRLGSLMSWE